MKFKKIKKSSGVGKNLEAIAELEAVANEADTLGTSYKKFKQTESEFKKAADGFANQIKKFAEEAGEPVKKMQLVRGKRYAVGYYERTTGSKVDEDKAEKLLPKPILDKCKSVDETKLARLVELGELSVSVLKKIVKGGKSTKYVVVKTIEELNAELKKDEEAENENPY